MQHSPSVFSKALDAAVNKVRRAWCWHVSLRYEVKRAADGRRYIQAAPLNESDIIVSPADEPDTFYVGLQGEPLDYKNKYMVQNGDESLKTRIWSRTYSPLHVPALFLEFAGLVEDTELEKGLDTERNVSIALDWTSEWGVLGLDLRSEDSPRPVLNYGAPHDIIGHILNVRPPTVTNRGKDQGTAAYGGADETVAGFAFEAWIANIVLRLYEALTRPGGPDIDAIDQYRSACLTNLLADLGGHPFDDDSPLLPEREVWARHLVEDTTRSKVQESCYPVLHRQPGEGYVQAWGFDTLLGAMWLQMFWLITASSEEVRRCQWCNRVLDFEHPEQPRDDPGLQKNVRGNYRVRKDKRFCSDKCRANSHYYRRKKP